MFLGPSLMAERPARARQPSASGLLPFADTERSLGPCLEGLVYRLSNTKQIDRCSRIYPCFSNVGFSALDKLFDGKTSNKYFKFHPYSKKEYKF